MTLPLGLHLPKQPERAWLLLTLNAKGCSKLVIGEC